MMTAITVNLRPHRQQWLRERTFCFNFATSEFSAAITFFSFLSCLHGIAMACCKLEDVKKMPERPFQSTQLSFPSKSFGRSSIVNRSFQAPCSPSPKSQHILRLGVLRFCSGTFLSEFSIPKSLVPPFSSHVCCHGNHATLAYFWTLGSPLFFKYFQLRETFCGLTFYALDSIIL